MLTERFDDALLYAHRLHRTQRRKGGGAPYISHLLGVASIVLEYGGDEDQAIAALLHDGPEDQGGRATLDEIRARFGPRVAGMVEGCTDAWVEPKPPWRARKEAYLAHLKDAPAQTRLVSAADKLYNARTILADVRRQGGTVYGKFTGGKDGTLWYYRSLAEIFTAEGPHEIAAELTSTVKDLEALSQ